MRTPQSPRAIRAGSNDPLDVLSDLEAPGFIAWSPPTDPAAGPSQFPVLPDAH
jgi:hypothetical protein